MDFFKIEKIIKDKGLKPTSQREMPLYSLSCIFYGYTKPMYKILGYSYDAVCGIGGDGKFHTLFNEEMIAQKTGEFIDNNYKDLGDIVFTPSINTFNECLERFKKMDDNDPVLSLKLINNIYSNYMTCIGIYNCFWRYIGNEASKGKLTTIDVESISRQRDIVAKFYPKVESKIKEYTHKIGEMNNFDGDLLRYLTQKEMGDYLGNRLNIIDILKVLNLRREKYLYLLTIDGYEETSTDKDLIGKIYEEFYLVKDIKKELNGFPAYKGIVKGRVFNKIQGNNSDHLVEKGYILVTSMTHPDDIYIIKESSAIITDEGGILSHAAIVAREMRKPCIIGTKIATQVLKDGDMVEVDADKGVVRIIK
ncbi:MAG: PEP-utilizing enzyme [Candidatus Paceibacterota bacterium]|jgi:phosphohistidine swiveling domain-containing protein